MTEPKPRRAPLRHLAIVHLAVGLVAGGLVAGAMALLGRPELAFIAGWIAMCVVHCTWVWVTVRKKDGHQTEELSQLEDSGRGLTDLVLLIASFASLAGVGVLLAGSSSKSYLEGVLGLAAVAVSWFLVHLLFMLRYARQFYGDGDRGIDFAGEDQPDFWDFAYLSFCLGMTYQVSDQTIKNKLIRRTVTRHTLLSYGLGAVVLACSINLVVQLAS